MVYIPRDSIMLLNVIPNDFHGITNDCECPLNAQNSNAFNQSLDCLNAQKIYIQLHRAISKNAGNCKM